MTRPETRPDIVIIMTDEERAIPPYESPEVLDWRRRTLTGRRWFDENGVSFTRHYTGSLACVPSRPTIFTGQYPDLHGVTQTDGIGKVYDDSRMRWLRRGEVPTLGNWFRAAGYDTHYDGKWHISHADLEDPATGEILATNDDDGVPDPAAVQRYLDADPLAPYGFSGWVGPEPHGALLANAGIRRDPLIADRVVAWLEDRYARRRAGDPDALRPFLLVASFVNPHDIVLFPGWALRSPVKPSHLDPPHVPPAPTADEDLRDKPAAQIAFREAYYSGYGPAPAIEQVYQRGAQRYRDLYYRLHAEVDSPIDRVRRAVTDNGSENAVLVRTADHGDLLGAHGGLHQKWFNLYDEATRVPFSVVRIGTQATQARVVNAPTSHVDLVPTLLGAAGVDVETTAAALRESFSEVHPLPGRDLMPVVDGAAADEGRPVYLMTRDNMLEGDSGASGLGRMLKKTANPPAPLRIRIPAHTAANFEGLVVRVDDADAPGGAGHLWKLVRSFDDPATWTEPGVRHFAANGPGGDVYRTSPLDDQWELYDLTADPAEAHNRWDDPALHELRGHLRMQLKASRAESVPERNTPGRTPHDEGKPVADEAPASELHQLADTLLGAIEKRLGGRPNSDALDAALAAFRNRAVEFVRRYHRLHIDLEVTSIREPVLFVANHGFGGIFDLNVLAAHAALEDLALDRPVTFLTHQLAWTLGVGPVIERLGARPASEESAAEAFARGEHVMVFPGGDLDAGKSFLHRNQIVFGGRTGFARLAIEQKVPIVPIVTAGAGESLLVLSDGKPLAKALRLDKLLRIKALPVSISLPWGVNIGAVGMVPYLPLPTKLHTTVLPAIKARRGEAAESYADRVRTAMQEALTAMTENRRPVLG